MALACWLPALLLVAMTVTTGASEDRANFDVTECYPLPTSTTDGGSAFRGNLLRLLEVLPLAAAPTGFASLQTADGAASDRALVRGLCFGDSAPEPCLRCLSDAGKKITVQCGDASRRAGFWDERCFLGYADGANSSSAGADDDFRVVSFSGDAVPSPDVVSVQRLVALAQSLAQRAATYGSVATADATTPASKGDATDRNRTVRVLAQCARCARDRGAADCARCLREASLAMAKSWEAGVDAQGRVAAVLGSNCYLRFEIWTPPLPLEEKIKFVGLLIVWVIVTLIDINDQMRMKARNYTNTAAEMIQTACVTGLKGAVQGLLLVKILRFNWSLQTVYAAVLVVTGLMVMVVSRWNNRNAAAAAPGR